MSIAGEEEWLSRPRDTGREDQVKKARRVFERRGFEVDMELVGAMTSVETDGE